MAFKDQYSTPIKLIIKKKILEAYMYCTKFE